MTKSSVRVSESADIDFTFEISHNEDFDPDCMVCTESTKVVEKILGEWLCEAIIVEEDWIDKNYSPGMNTKSMLILKRGDKPTLARLLEWFTSNFDDTIKLAAIDSIVFREHGTENSYECIIKY